MIPNPLNNTPYKKQVAPPSPTPPSNDIPFVQSFWADTGGCAYWRMGWSDMLLNTRNLAITHGTNKMILEPRYYNNLKAVRLQRQCSSHQLQFVRFLKDIQQKAGFKLMYEVDDIHLFEDIPDYNKNRDGFKDPTLRDNIITIMNLCDEVTVTNEFMRDYFIQKTGQKSITVLPNFPPKFWIGNFFNHTNVVRNFEKNKKRPRILYAGSGCHFDTDRRVQGKDDFEYINDFIISTLKKYKWVFFGAIPLRLIPYVKSGDIEFHKWVGLTDYPSKLYELGVQATIAPLQDNTFNRAKSNIKWLEACSLGIPCICQDMCTYNDALFKFKDVNQLEYQLSHVLQPSRYKTLSPKLYKIASEYFLENDENIMCVYESLMTNYGDPRRKYLKKYNL